MNVDYEEYIQSVEWRRRANEAKRRAGYRCRVCNRSSSQVTLDAHHRTYERLGHEDPDDITVLCRDCHELFEMNKKVLRPASRQYQPTTHQTTSTTERYTVNQNTPSKELVLPSKTISDRRSFQSSGKIVALTVAGVLLSVTLITVITLFSTSLPETNDPLSTPIPQPSSPIKTLIAATLTPIPTSQVSTLIPQEGDSPAMATVKQDVDFHSGPGAGRPILGTLTKGRTIIISGYVLCVQTVWYHIVKYGWIRGEFVDSNSINVPYHNIDCLASPTRMPTRTSAYSGPSPADCAKETNEEWANLCWNVVEEYYRDRQDNIYNYEPDDYYYDEPSDEPYYDLFEVP